MDKNVGSGAGLGLNLETATRQLSVALRLFAVMSPSECPPYRVVVKTPGSAKLSELCLHFEWAPYTFSCWVLFLRVSWPISGFHMFLPFNVAIRLLGFILGIQKHPHKVPDINQVIHCSTLCKSRRPQINVPQWELVKLWPVLRMESWAARKTKRWGRGTFDILTCRNL